MHRPQRHRRKAWRTAKPTTPGFRPPWATDWRSSENPSAGLTRREKFWLGGLAMFACIGFILFTHFTASWDSKRHLDDFLERLRVQYSLNDVQIAAIRGIENEYHGAGGIFFTPSRNFQDKLAHDIEISRQMSPEVGARFLTDLQAKNPSIKKNRH